MTPIKIKQSSSTPSTTEPTNNLHRRQPQKPPQAQPTEPQEYSLELDHTPFPKVLEPLLTRTTFFIYLWTIKIIGTLWLWYQNRLHPQPPSSNPDLIKRYPTRPNLPVSLFFPPSSSPTKSPSHPKFYPLYISIHGGGLVLGTSQLDNSLNRAWSTRTGMLVASLNYTKTPTSPFPYAIEDISAVTTSLLSDTTLPIDHSKIVIGGSSAGGLLALSAVQLPPLKDKVRAVVAYYPAVDFSENPPTKFAKRLDKTRGFEALHTFGGALDWGYVAAGVDRRDRILSPTYASRDQLPARVCVVGAQYDMFCREGRDMIFRLAGRGIRDDDDDEAGWRRGFEVGGYKWIYARGMRHGFMDVVGRKDGPWDVKRREFCERMNEDIHQWLTRHVL